ncbi:hypothetical protein ACHAXA_006716 [Cyclostephanos tholiformis]|uniref:Uncharacterized protein n=1 Tax=Cyclostephanos tholiformis TaxID=382380 RepID=A0ABD3SS02_9STRA
MLDDALAAIDHIASRVTASSVVGLCCGAAYGSYRGHPMFKTSVSTAFSFALVSTACFVMERAADVALRQLSSSSTPPATIVDDDDDNSSGEEMASSAAMTTWSSPTLGNSGLHYGSHALGGFLGGGVVGFLFQGKPLSGSMLMTPMMIIIGKIEALVEEHRAERMRQLMVEHIREQEKRSP